ncbi:MAG: CAAD domain-containing protein [Trichodesmium sp. St16_bin4-tuft]|nr:CAAD domain-containing protein [Trichodesmium sp. St16_bin4-tuft]
MATTATDVTENTSVETQETQSQITTPVATTPTATDVTENTSVGTQETQSQITTPVATTPTATDAETREQKVATQVETSILDDQKPVDTVTNQTVEVEQPNKIKEQFINIFFNFPDYINQLYQQYQGQLKLFGWLALVILTFTFIAVVIEALDGIPILSIIFELIGVIYLVWFVYRYLLKRSNRQELLDKIENIKREIFGKPS